MEVDIPYDLKLLKVSDTIKLTANNTRKENEFYAYSKLDLPMIKSFKYETSSYLKIMGSFWNGIKFGSKLILILICH